MIKEGRCK